MFTIWTSFPDAPFASSLILGALKNNFPNHTIITSPTKPTTTPNSNSNSASKSASASNSPPTNPSSHSPPLLQWCTYDLLSHEDTLTNSKTVLASSYTIRKSLIRKTFLHRAVSTYMSKHSESYLSTHPGSIPQTWAIDISWADELDELYSDELWELGELLDRNEEGELDGGERGKEKKWFILKPSMADRGQGIRLFESRDALREIFESFEEDEDEEDENEDGDESDEDKDDEDVDGSNAGKVDTTVIASQLRHFVIQEYMPSPLLLDPGEAKIPGSSPKPLESLQPRKFHIRAYCVASGALKVYVCTNFLALFAGAPYTPPRRLSSSSSSANNPDNDDDDQDQETKELDLTPHLTNTSLQTPTPENPDPNDNVRLLSEMVGCHILSPSSFSSSTKSDPDANGDPSSSAVRDAINIDILTDEDVTEITNQVCNILADTFRAAVASSVHFQPLPNAFELFGVDLLVSHNSDSDYDHESRPEEPSSSSSLPKARTSKFTVSLLELNAEPAIELTGARLSWVLEEMFDGICKACVEPFFQRFDVDVDGDGDASGGAMGGHSDADSTVMSGNVNGAPPKTYGSVQVVREREGESVSRSDGLGQSTSASEEAGKWEVGETRWTLRKCLDMQVRSERGW